MKSQTETWLFFIGSSLISLEQLLKKQKLWDSNSLLTLLSFLKTNKAFYSIVRKRRCLFNEPLTIKTSHIKISTSKKSFYYLWKRHTWWQHSRLNGKYQMDNILELLSDRYSRFEERKFNRCWFFPRLLIFPLSKADLSSFIMVELARNLLITWSLSPNDNRPVLDGSLLLFRRL
jgi:hypothetical protein